MTQPPQIADLTFVRTLGSGGYADVYEYEQQLPRMTVAVKVLKAEVTPQVQRAFTAEANAMAQLADHPYIVQVFRGGFAGDGRAYMVMKYYPPPNLGARARHQALSVAEVLRTGIQMCGAIETAHRAGILHRDVKPANILVSPYGTPGLTDFGIAALVGEDSSDDVGVSIPWAAPEILGGVSRGSPQSDVYSLAATLYDLLVGRSPFEIPGGDNGQRAVMARVLTMAPPSSGRSDVPVALDRLLQQAMAKEPAHRPPSALRFARALQTVEQQQQFGRTEIVVPIETTWNAPRPATPDAPEATKIRAQRVEGQHIPPPPQPGPAQRTVPPQFASPEGIGTVVRPAVHQGQAPPTGAAAAGHADYAAAGHGSLVGAPPEPLPAPTGKGVKPAVVIGVAAALVAGAVGLALVLGGSDGKQAQTPPTTPTTLNNNPSDVPPPTGITVFAAERVNATTVRFKWDYKNKDAEDTFLWEVTPTGQTGSARTASQDITAPAGKEVCFKVRVRRAGLGIDEQPPWSAPRCTK